MLTKDTQKIQEHVRAERQERVEDRTRKNLIDEIQSNTITVESDAGRDVTSVEAQMGRPLTAAAIKSKLKRICNRLYFEESKSDPSKIGVYLQDPTGKIYVNPQGEVLNLIHICGMESGISPEFSVLHKGKKRVANPALMELLGNKKPTRDIPQWIEVDTVIGETRGWRTVLLRLMHHGLITEHDVNKHFGWTPTHQSEKWQKQVN